MLGWDEKRWDGEGWSGMVWYAMLWGGIELVVASAVGTRHGGCQWRLGSIPQPRSCWSVGSGDSGVESRE